jgi:aryl-alcohol dehydrogenase
MEVSAALTIANGEPLLIDAIELAEPSAGEGMVRVAASGLCHTDITTLDAIPLPWPGILGHEGAGIIVATGAGVSSVNEGDHVVLTTASCGVCRNCEAEDPAYCLNFRTCNLGGGFRKDGSCTRNGDRVFALSLGQSACQR